MIYDLGQVTDHVVDEDTNHKPENELTGYIQANERQLVSMYFVEVLLPENRQAHQSQFGINVLTENQTH